MPLTKPEKERVHRSSASLQFVPRPILLRFHSFGSNLATGADTKQQNNDQYLNLQSLSIQIASMASNGQVVKKASKRQTSTDKLPTHLTAITTEQANLLSGPDFGCANPMTNYHNLDCGHAILTSIDWPSDACPKSACASNCAPKGSSASSATEHAAYATHNQHRRAPATPAPFICPTCVEIALNRAYIKVWTQYRYEGFLPAGEPAVNVGIWTYCAIRALQNAGLRRAQGTTGIFLFSYEHEYTKFSFVPSIVKGACAKWSFEGRKTNRGRRRSRSPEQFGDEGRALSPVTANQRHRHRGRGSSRDDDDALDELADRLEDVRVGLTEDRDIDGLLAGIDGMLA
jgi:hypothetical protein